MRSPKDRAASLKSLDAHTIFCDQLANTVAEVLSLLIGHRSPPDDASSKSPTTPGAVPRSRLRSEEVGSTVQLWTCSCPDGLQESVAHCCHLLLCLQHEVSSMQERHARFTHLSLLWAVGSAHHGTLSMMVCA
jgi:hypothetical protein